MEELKSKEPERCIHEMIIGTCSLCKGYKQTIPAVGPSDLVNIFNNDSFFLINTVRWMVRE